MNTKTLSEKAMLVSLNISVWDRYKFDDKVSQEVADSHGTTKKAGRYNKNLLPFDPPSYKAVTQIAGETRQLHYKFTLPWQDDGARILPSANWTKYTDAVRTLQSKFNAAAQDFVADAPGLFARALRELNGLGNAADFPDVEQLANKFDFRVKFYPFPSADDFRVTLQPSDVQAIQQEIEQHVNETLVQAMKEPFKKLHKVVKAMAEKLADVDAVFRDSLVTNIEELLEVLPSLNLTGDHALTDACDEIKASLVVDPDALRQSTVIRNDIALKAKAIADNLAGWMQ